MDIAQSSLADLKRAFGSFPTGVTVMTTLDPAGAPVGMTASSFNTVSLSPPLVLWSIRCDSHKRAAFSRNDRFAVNILAEGQTEACYVLDSPEAYCRGLACAILARGGRFVQARVEGIETGGDGIRLRTAAGTQATDRAVIAAGAWSRGIARGFGQRLNMNTERGYHVAFAPHEGLLNHAVMYPSDGFFLTPLRHQIRAAGTIELGGLDKPARAVRLRVLEQKARRMLPALGDRQDSWLGFRPSSPDSLPFIGPSRRDPRVFFACGHGHMGVTLAGITGQLIAQLIDGVAPALDLSPFAPDRATFRIRP